MKKRKLVALLLAAAIQMIPMTVYADQWQGTDGAWWYQHDDGTYAIGWRYINGKWYYFDSYGYMKTGWVYAGDKWYYLNPGGDMLTGWLVLEGKTYYLYEDGSMATGFFTDGNYYYLAESDGSIVKDTIRNGMKFDESGCVMQRDASGSWTYVGSVESRIELAKETLMNKYLNHEYATQTEFETEVRSVMAGSMTEDEIEDFIYEVEQLFWDSYEVSYNNYRD